MTHRRGRAIVLATFAIAAVLVWDARREGPDFGHYYEWGLAALSRNIFELGGDLLSRPGVPFSLASAAPGMLFAVTHYATGQQLEFRTAAYVTGWAAAMLFWAAAFAALRAVARGNLVLVLFGATALFLGTHAGFYSYTHSTEVLASALVAATWAIALSQTPRGVLAVVAAGSCAGLLLFLRPYLVLYALPPLWFIVFERFTAGRRSYSQTAVRIVIVGIPLVLAAVEAAVVNRWMTGSPFQPAYVYGGFGFQSMDLLHPQIATVLTHPWRGLLVYHPLYGVAFVALLMSVWQAGPWRVMWILTTAVVLIHLWIQAAWHIWWLGASFGMRGLAPAALPLVLALTAMVAHEVEQERRRPIWWVRASLAACVWSVPLLWTGNSQSLVWSVFLGGQKPAAIALGILAIVWLAISLCRERWRVPDTGMEILGSGFVLLAVTFGFLISQTDGFSARLMAAAAAIAVSLFFLQDVPAWNRLSVQVLCAAMLAFFAGQALVFTRLAVQTERRIASGAPLPREFRAVGSVPVDALRQNYVEYTNIPGFVERKRKLLGYLNWLDIDTAQMTTADRALSERVLRSLSADPIAGEMILRVSASNGTVRLASTADTNSRQRDRAVELARAVPGVASVEADMK